MNLLHLENIADSDQNKLPYRLFIQNIPMIRESNDIDYLQPLSMPISFYSEPMWSWESFTLGQLRLTPYTLYSTPSGGTDRPTKLHASLKHHRGSMTICLCGKWLPFQITLFLPQYLFKFHTNTSWETRHCPGQIRLTTLVMRWSVFSALARMSWPVCLSTSTSVSLKMQMEIQYIFHTPLTYQAI